MSEPQSKAGGSHDARDPPVPSPPADSDSPAAKESAAPRVNVAVTPESGDEAPTVISKALPGQAPDSAFSHKLRGRRLAHFELLEPIGVGGMAAVLRARDTQLDRVIALKILPPEMAVDPENIRRFQQEARAAAKLDHENIARVFFCGEDQGLHFIAFEFVEGENVRTILERRGRVPVPEAIHYVLQVATGLAHSATRGVVHRDIKPSNIIIGANGRAKLVDMGLARSLGQQSDRDLTQSGVTLGTFDYISPEQALEPRQADVRSDIYSLGCTFYHMLTGQPPIPEGTAAKKLHHHQHVAPVDPRQINPDIPDEVAAVLARMMAKDPKDRYQQAEHLVQHLLQLAQKLGAGLEMPNGVLFVDAPLPNPPRLRPVLVGVAATFLLVAFIALQQLAQLASKPSGSTETAQAKGQPADQPKPESIKNPAPAAPREEKPAPVQAKKETPVVHSAGELAQLLSDSDIKGKVYLDQDLDLSAEKMAGAPGGVGLVFDGGDRELEISPPDAGLDRIRRIRLAYKGEPAVSSEADSIFAALSIKSGKITLRRLRFEIDAGQAPGILMAAVRKQAAGQLVFDRCEFVQINPPMKQGWLSSLVLEGGEANAGTTIADCYFAFREGNQPPSNIAAGQEAIRLMDGAGAYVKNCAFAPHAVLFHVVAGRRPEAHSIRIRQCSAMLLDGAFVLLDRDVSCGVGVHQSLVTCPDSTLIAPNGPSLIQTGERASLRYEGKDNCYHGLAAFWQKPNDSAVALDEFNLKLGNAGSETNAKVLAISPWQEANPLDLIRKERPQEAFRAKVNLPELRQDKGMVGIQSCAWGNEYESLPSEVVAAPRQLIVDPSLKSMTNKGEYRSIGQALVDVKENEPGEILIRANGLIRVEPVRLEKAATNVTIKPFPGFHPLLALGDTSDTDAAIFRLNDGQLRLEDLDFVLRPLRAAKMQDMGRLSQEIIRLGGAGQCTFKNCAVTLETEETDGIPLSVVALADPKEVMKMEQPSEQKQPRVRLENCFIRGRGEMVAVRASRSFDLEVENSLIVLAGSFLNIEGNAKEPAVGQAIQLRCTHVTTYLTDYLILLRAGSQVQGLVPVKAQASDCLFASANGKSLVHLEGMDANETQMKSLFSWAPERNSNLYSHFEQMLDQRPRTDEMPVQAYNMERWKMTWDEANGKFLASLKFAEPPSALETFARATPAHFNVREAEYKKYGAPLALLPLPKSAEARPRPSSPEDIP